MFNILPGSDKNVIQSLFDQNDYKCNLFSSNLPVDFLLKMSMYHPNANDDKRYACTGIKRALWNKIAQKWAKIKEKYDRCRSVYF